MSARTEIEVGDADVIQPGNKAVVVGPALNLVLVRVARKGRHQILIGESDDSVRVVVI